VLHHDQQIAKPATFQAELPAVEVAAEELNLARTLIDASTGAAFDLARYPDGYTDQLRRLIEAKAAGKEIVAPPPETPQVINLMEALQQSYSAPAMTTKISRTMAPSQTAVQTSSPIKHAIRATTGFFVPISFFMDISCSLEANAPRAETYVALRAALTLSAPELARCVVQIRSSCGQSSRPLWPRCRFRVNTRRRVAGVLVAIR